MQHGISFTGSEENYWGSRSRKAVGIGTSEVICPRCNPTSEYRKPLSRAFEHHEVTTEKEVRSLIFLLINLLNDEDLERRDLKNGLNGKTFTPLHHATGNS